VKQTPKKPTDTLFSTGEAALLGLDGQELLPPHDPKFRPSPESLRWRFERLAG